MKDLETLQMELHIAIRDMNIAMLKAMESSKEVSDRLLELTEK